MYLNKQNFHTQILKLIPNFKDQKFLLAVSGGADSMVLANLFLSSNLNFQVAHINYKLRGEDSDLDEKIVQSFCKKNGIKLHLYKVSEVDKKPENSIQLWARNLRYDFFNKIKTEENLDFIATAHHLNDELETFIINLSRASGLKGLSGIPKNDNSILRPLLKFSKDEIYQFAEENKIEFREDKSNAKTDYLRNFIRHEIAPKLLQTNENFLENFSKTLTYLKEANDFIDVEIENKRKNISKEKNSKIIFNKEKFKNESDLVKFKLLKIYNFKDSKEIAKILMAKTGGSFFSKSHSLKISSNELIIKPLDYSHKENLPIVIRKTSEIHVSKFIENYKMQQKIWEVDSSRIKWPVIIRKPLPKDVFQPTGMRGKKKVTKFIRELKISDLDFQPLVLVDSGDTILGIIPQRQNEIMISKNSTEILTIFL